MRRSKGLRLSRAEYAQLSNDRRNKSALRGAFDLHWNNRLENDPTRSAFITQLLKKRRQGANEDCDRGGSDV